MRHHRADRTVDPVARFSHFCAWDGDGAVIAEGRVATTPAAMEVEFKAAARKRIAIEAGMHSPWLSRLLKRLGHEVLVANPRKLRLIYENSARARKTSAVPDGTRCPIALIAERTC